MVFPINLSILDMNYFISKFLKVYVQIVTFFNLPQKTIVDLITSLMFIAELGQIFLSFLRVLAEAELSVSGCCTAVPGKRSAGFQQSSNAAIQQSSNQATKQSSDPASQQSSNPATKQCSNLAIHLSRIQQSSYTATSCFVL